MTDNKPLIFTDDDRMLLNENRIDHDIHFLPRPEEQEDKSANDDK